MKLAFDGITSFSYKPLVISSYFGGLTFFVGLISLVAVVIENAVNHTSILNFGLVIAINLLMFGLIFISIGIMGQYIGRIFDESKARPNYIIASTINYNKTDKKNQIN
jgi:dolichol-phosphate mannosyltransferase